MNDTKALIRRDDARLTVDFTEAALALKASALETAALIGRVSNADEQHAAVASQTEIANLLNLAEKARKTCKEPVLEYGRRIDGAAKDFCAELKEEQVRLATLVGDYQTMELARVRAAEQAEKERLLALEREKAREMQQAQSHEQMEAIQERFNERAAAEAPAEPITPTRAPGQRVSEEWEITVTDIWLLAKAHPMCVKVEPRLVEIKTLLNAGVKVSGVRAEKVVKASVRVGRQMAAIEV